MRSAVLVKPYTFSLEDREIPTCKPEEVLLKMRKVGICGSDMQKYHGKHQHLKMPQVIGHECVAEVVTTGQRVAVFPQVSCGTCAKCRSGQENLCRNSQFAGLQIPGFFQEYVTMPASNLIPLSDRVSDNLAMLAEPVAVAAHALRQGSITKGSNVVVIGAGTIGHLIAELSHGIGAKVLSVESLENRARIVKSVGADAVYGGPMEGLKEAVTEFFGEEGADVFVISRAVAKDLDTILHQANEGSTVVIVGNYKEPATVDWTVIERRELTVKGAFRYYRADFEQAISYLEQGLIDPEAVITHHFPFAKIAEAYQLADTDFRNVLKIAIDFQ